jgi:DNA-binding transcriptional regulator LsrR (DeoR family)
MARLRKGEKSRRKKRVQRLLRRYNFGLRESEIASELGWHRRTVNNYLRELERQGRVYKDGRCWLADD